MFLVDFMILTFEVGPDRTRESNVRINPLGMEPLYFGCPATQRDSFHRTQDMQVGFGSGLVDEDQTTPIDPPPIFLSLAAPLYYLGAGLPGGQRPPFFQAQILHTNGVPDLHLIDPLPTGREMGNEPSIGGVTGSGSKSQSRYVPESGLGQAEYWP